MLLAAGSAASGGGANSITSIGSEPVAVVVVGIAALYFGRRIASHLGRVEHNKRLTNIATFSLVLHLICAPAQIFIVDHVYKGVADYNRYLYQGARLADNLRSGDFSFAGTGITRIIGDGMMSVISGGVLTVLGPNKLAEFLFFAFLSFVGDVFFYRAFSITFPNANSRRYAYLIFFLPSLLFWTADVSKEALMTFALGLATLGIARVLARAKNGYIWIVVGSAIGLSVRPHEVALLLVGFAVAMLFRQRDPNVARRGLRRFFTFVFVGAILVVAAVITRRYLGNTGSLSTFLQNVHHSNNTGTGAGFGSSSISYSASPLYYPKDVYSVLFDPLPFNAHGLSELLAAAENTLLVVVLLASLRQLRAVPRAALWRPYVLVCLIYTLAFLYVFAALGNLGLIERERVLLLPYLAVLFCIPVTPKKKRPAYPWDRGVKQRRSKGRGRGRSPTPVPVPAGR
jgi:hypothetical protein